MSSDSSTALFFSTLFSPGDLILFRPIETWTEGGRKHTRVEYPSVCYQRTGLRDQAGNWHPFTDTIAATIARLAAESKDRATNIFFGVCPRFGGDGRYDLAWQIRTVRVLWADVDDATPAIVTERIRAAQLPLPTAVVSSGNGSHVYWSLSSPVAIADAGGDPPPVFSEFTEASIDQKRKRRQFIIATTGEHLYLSARQNCPELSPTAQHVQDILSGLAQRIGGDHTQDLSRLLRVPGTMNRKDQRNGRQTVPCELVELEPARQYAIEDFEHLAPSSPSRVRRLQISQLPLPKPKRLTQKKQTHLDELIAACAVADVGSRSEADFAVCCYAVEQGIDKPSLWSQIAGVGKFSEAGERYFDMTWSAAQGHTRGKIFDRVAARREKREKAAESASGPVETSTATARSKFDPTEASTNPITNALVEYDGEQPITTPLPMTDILARIYENADAWPRRVDDALFVHDPSRGICWLEASASMFGWLSGRCGVISWSRVPGCVTKEEAFHEVKRTCERYKAIEHMPHEPRIPNHYYACQFPAAGNGQHITELVDRFAPESEIDRQLILAMFATIFWGGSGGTRPAFVVTSDAGRGAGKSKLTDMVSRLAGGCVELSSHEDASEIRKRLLSPEGMSKRIARLDNVKTLKFSWSDLESLITAHEISGRRLYAGEGTRPNTLTWLITLNGISLSTDMAQRSVIIKVVRPQRQAKWEEETSAFIERHRQDIIADLIGFLQLPSQPLKKHSRWAAWEGEVLARLADPEEAQAVILQRSQESDAEAEEIELVEKYFQDQISRYQYEVDACRVHIPSKVAGEWYNAAMGSKRTIPEACKILTQFCQEGRGGKIRVNPSRKYGRGFLWVTYDGNADYDLEDRISSLENFSSSRKQHGWK